MQVGCFVFAIILVLYVTTTYVTDDESGLSDQQQSSSDEPPYYIHLSHSFWPAVRHFVNSKRRVSNCKNGVWHQMSY